MNKSRWTDELKSSLQKSRLITLAIFAAVPLTLSACVAPVEPTVAPGPAESTATPIETEPIKFGFMGPLTGPTAGAGNALLLGAKLKVAELNAAGGINGRLVELIPCDDQSTPAVGVACVNKFVSLDNIDVFVSTLHSPIILATAEITEAASLPTIGAGVGDYCTKGYEFLWRGGGTDAVNVRTLGSALTTLSISRIATLHQNDEFGTNGADALKGLPGITEITRQAFAPGDKDWTGQIINLTKDDPDAVAVWGLGEDMGPITKQLREQGWTGPIVGSQSYSFPGAIEVAQDTANGVIFAAPYYIPEKAEDYPIENIRDFLIKFVAENGALPASDNAYRAYDAVGILAEAISRAGSADKDAVRDSLNTISDFAGLGGTFDFATNGCDGLQQAGVFKIANRSITGFDGKLN